MFVHNWNTDINDSTRARCYIVFTWMSFVPWLKKTYIKPYYWKIL